MRISGRVCVVRTEFREYLHLPQDTGVLLSDVRRVLRKLSAGLPAAHQRLLPLLFSESTVAAQIVDGQGQPVYRAKNAPVLTRDQLRASARESVSLNADTRLQSAPVQDGRVYCIEDISKIVWKPRCLRSAL